MATKVTLQTAGGMAAPFAPPPTVVEADDLDEAAQQDLHQLVKAADARDPAADDDGPGLRRDAQSYEITVEDTDGSVVVLSAVDGAVTPQFAQLRDWIRDHGRAGG
ncbi:protealysin inhibitor emfourin [Cellulomonas sp. URHE0023]|uniref:protealysin inhibitor emfourin n=1 Tax=Cellulomonas sp. URHE0023 TaxID=1380354 RepID=UPI0004880571|nr:protealysin inhibitor emfourin [Cellulomonas sp. URHE0023]